MAYQKNSTEKSSSKANNSVGDSLSSKKGISFSAVPALQKAAAEEEEPLQGKFEPVQKAEEEEPLQGKFEPVQKAEEEEPLQGKFETVQKAEEEEPLQGKFEPVQKAEEEEALQGKFETVQKAEEEEPLQAKFETVQKAEEEEPLQAKFETVQKVEEEEPLQGKFEPVQKAEEEEPLQGKFGSTPAQKKEAGVNAFQLKTKDSGSATAQLEDGGAGAANKTGMPSTLKSGIENLSGFNMDDVKVHYNSDKPKQLQAHAYAQGTDIHIGPGQEKHLPHEAWHVAQQKQGRVEPTIQMKQGVPVNDDKGLENEADVMGAQAAHTGAQLIAQKAVQRKSAVQPRQSISGRPIQFATPEQNAAFNQKNAGIISFSANAPAVLGMGFWTTLQQGGLSFNDGVAGAEVAGGVSGFAGDVTDAATGAGDASEALQKQTGDKTKFVDKAEGNILGAIGSSLSALVNVIKTVQSISDGVGGKTSKMAAGTQAGIAMADAIKAGFEAAINVQKFATGSVSGQLLSALPGLGLAIEAAKFVVNMYQAFEAEKAEVAMTDVSAEYGGSLKTILGKDPIKQTQLFGSEKRGKMFNRITYTRLKPGLIDQMEAIENMPPGAAKATAENKFKTDNGLPSGKTFMEIHTAIRLYEMGSKMAEINQKRKVKGARDMATGLLKIGGEIAAFFPGMGTAVAGGLKGAAAGVEVAQAGAKFIQGKARDKGILGADKNRGSAQKHKEYVSHTKSVYRALAGMIPSPATVEDAPKVSKAENILGSTGVYIPALFKTNYAEETSVKGQAETIIESMKAGR